uniref:Kelch repeat-containing protein At3g27220 isoform X1 n=1 Tax=Rhizophora mucronata TaxID=61149 RepID=A0A2P2K343_RHIMU
MVRATGKPRSATRLVIVCVGLLGIGLIADYLWASSSHFVASPYYLSSWARNDESLNTLIVPYKKDGVFINNATSPQHKAGAEKDKKKKKNGNDKKDAPERFLSATFADLPAPELEWEKMIASPVPRLDGAAIQIKNLLYVFAGYGTIDYVRTLSICLLLF